MPTRAGIQANIATAYALGAQRAVFQGPSPSGGDDTSALTTFFGSVPDGSGVANVIRLQPGTYRIDTELHLTARHWLTFDLNGATLQWNTPDDTTRRLFWFTNCDYMTVKNGTMIGTYTYPTSGDAHNVPLQFMHAIEFDQGMYGRVENMAIRGFYGDGVMLGTELGFARSLNNTIVGCDIRQVGRNAVSVIAADDTLIHGCHIQQTGLNGVDIEPDLGGYTCSRTTVTSNTWGGQGGTVTRRVFMIVPRVAIDTVEFSNNTISGRDASIWINDTGSFTPWEERVTGVTVTNNTCDTNSVNGIWRVNATDTYTVSGNTIPMVSGNTIQLRDVCDYSITGTTFTEVTPCA